MDAIWMVVVLVQSTILCTWWKLYSDIERDYYVYIYTLSVGELCNFSIMHLIVVNYKMSGFDGMNGLCVWHIVFTIQFLRRHFIESYFCVLHFHLSIEAMHSNIFRISMTIGFASVPQTARKTTTTIMNKLIADGNHSSHTNRESSLWINYFFFVHFSSVRNEIDTVCVCGKQPSADWYSIECSTKRQDGTYEHWYLRVPHSHSHTQTQPRRSGKFIHISTKQLAVCCRGSPSERIYIRYRNRKENAPHQPSPVCCIAIFMNKHINRSIDTLLLVHSCNWLY